MTIPLPTLLVLGGTSDIGMAIADSFAQQGWTIILAVRDLASGRRNSADLEIRRQVPVRAVAFDIIDRERHRAFLDELGELPDAVVCVVGLLGEQVRAQVDAEHASLIMRTNYEMPAIFLGLVGERMRARKSGLIVGVSSVAGERGRRSNYVYGSAKAGFTAFLSGLRAALRDDGVRVVTVKPGFVATQMTAGLALPKPVTAQPEEVARAVQRVARGGPTVIYVRPVWRLIMIIIRLLPEPIFSRMKS